MPIQPVLDKTRLTLIGARYKLKQERMLRAIKEACCWFSLRPYGVPSGKSAQFVHFYGTIEPIGRPHQVKRLTLPIGIIAIIYWQ